MTILYEERSSDSLYVDTIMHGWTVSEGSTIRPATINWHMVFAKHNSHVKPVYVGPLTTAGVASWQEGVEILWIRFKLGTFLLDLPARDFLDMETYLPGAASQSFWLKGSAWEIPNFENTEMFINRLVREDMLVCDPVVNAVLQDQLPEISLRTVRHHFLRATGVSHSHIWQVKRAQRAEALLKQGVSILDTVHELGYFDQPHLTRSLKQLIGYTPAQIIDVPVQTVRLSQPE